MAHATQLHGREGPATPPPLPGPATPPMTARQLSTYGDMEFPGRVEMDLSPPPRTPESVSSHPRASIDAELTGKDTLWGFDDELGEWERDVLIEYFDEAPTYTPPQSKFNSQNFRQKETSQDAPQTAALSPQPAAAAHVHDADINQNPEPPYPQFDKSSKALGDPRDYTRQKAFTGSGAGELVPQHWLNPSLPLVQDTAEERVQRSLNMAAKQRDEYYRGFIARTRGSAASAHATTEDTSPLHQPRSTTPELQEREETVNLRYLF
eukprot:Tamp_19318.p1 GENE.Tamp_19318~~Tamp_19318.p1  ORF type:complete len:294 (+),score=29.41 Tamp_19318:89-883(+)